jgi:hypothetical protein
MFVAAIIKVQLLFAASGCTVHRFFFLPPWYEYLKLQPDEIGHCSPVFKFPDDIWLVGLALLHLLLTLAGFLAVLSIIAAGLEYIFTQGNAEKGVAARKRVVNSIIGLAIVIIATGIVSFVGNTVAKGL